MASKSVSQHIYDEFIAKLSKDRSISEQFSKSLKKLIESGNPKKQDIVELLKKEEGNYEDSRT